MVLELKGFSCPRRGTAVLPLSKVHSLNCFGKYFSVPYGKHIYIKINLKTYPYPGPGFSRHIPLTLPYTLIHRVNFSLYTQPELYADGVVWGLLNSPYCVY